MRVLLFLLLFTGQAHSQSFYLLNFNSYANGTTSDITNGWLTSGCPTCLNGDEFEVQNGELIAHDVNDWVFISIDIIDISSCDSIWLNMDLRESGDIDGPDLCGGCGINIDFITVQFKIDGIVDTIVNYQGDGTSTSTLTGDRLNGLTNDADFGTKHISYLLPIGNLFSMTVFFRNTAGDEIFGIDNIELVGNCGPLHQVVPSPNLQSSHLPISVYLLDDVLHVTGEPKSTYIILASLHSQVVLPISKSFDLTGLPSGIYWIRFPYDKKTLKIIR